MKIYDSYQEAKIDNPDFAIFNYQGKFGTDQDIIDHFNVNSTEINECFPEDYCINLGELRVLHGGEVGGDVILGHGTGRVRVISKEEAIDRDFDAENFVLRSAVMKIPTQSPEEREALDMIDTTSKPVEGLANDSELPNGSEWESGLPPVGVECCFTPDNNLWGFSSTDAYFGEVLKYEGEQFVFLLAHDKYNMRPCHLIVSRTDKGEFSKPESPEQKAERERLDLVKKACLTVRHDYGLMSESDSNFLEKAGLEWLKAFEKEGYRKEQK